MLSESTNLSIEILRSVLSGATYEAVAAAQGLTRTAIEHRVKRLAKDLHRQVGIVGLNAEATGYVHKLRESKAAVEEALARFEAGYTRPAAPPQVLTASDVRTIVQRAGQHSPTPLRDMALVHIVLATGARPLEVARLEIADYLNSDGTIRHASEMRASVSVNRKVRPLFFKSMPAVRAIDAYLAQRQQQLVNSTPCGAPFRGFDPADRLFLNDQGSPYLVLTHEVEGRQRFLCRQMLDTYRRIFKRINMHGLSALTLRRTVAARLDARGADEDQIGLILGITEKQAVRDLLPRRPEVAELMTDLFSDAEFLQAPAGTDLSYRIVE